MGECPCSGSAAASRCSPSARCTSIRLRSASRRTKAKRGSAASSIPWAAAPTTSPPIWPRTGPGAMRSAPLRCTRSCRSTRCSPRSSSTSARQRALTPAICALHKEFNRKRVRGGGYVGILDQDKKLVRTAVVDAAMYDTDIFAQEEEADALESAIGWADILVLDADLAVATVNHIAEHARNNRKPLFMSVGSVLAGTRTWLPSSTANAAVCLSGRSQVIRTLLSTLKVPQRRHRRVPRLCRHRRRQAPHSTSTRSAGGSRPRTSSAATCSSRGGLRCWQPASAPTAASSPRRRRCATACGTAPRPAPWMGRWQASSNPMRSWPSANVAPTMAA